VEEDASTPPPEAAAMYDYYHRHVVAIGGDFHAFEMVRKGRVIYMAETVSSPDPDAPAVPSKDFRSLVTEVSGPLASHAHGCTSAL
jgi:hypothetical protein